MIGIPIAFGLTMIVCFTLFYYYWRIRQLRARLLSVQSAPAHEDFPVEFGIGKNVVETFPTIKACELKCTASEDMQCPICLVEYEEWEVLRQLPFCGHIFHTLCVGAWFEKQTTCPVCRMSMSELTESFGVEDVLYRGPRSSDAAVVEVVNTETPSWIMINRRLPLPAPPTPESPTTETAHTCTCSGNQSHGHGTESLTTQPKAILSHSPGGCDAIQTRGPTDRGSTDFHVVNIQQVREACSKCKSTAKPMKTVASSDDHSLCTPASQQHSDVQILIFQTSALSRTDQLERSDPLRLDVERLVSEGVSSNLQVESQRRAQETIGSAAISQPILEAVEGGCDNSGARDPAQGRGPEDVQTVLESPQGSFEFQPILTETGEVTYRATTL